MNLKNLELVTISYIDKVKLSILGYSFADIENINKEFRDSYLSFIYKEAIESLYYDPEHRKEFKNKFLSKYNTKGE